MVDIDSIIPFPGQPGQRPIPGEPSDVIPVEVILVAAPLDREYRNIALNTAAVDAYIAAQITSELAFTVEVERWSPWSPLQLDLPLSVGVGFNYGRFTIDGRHWYAFLDGEYLNRTSQGNTVRFTPVPDYWTTYGPEIGYSFIERGHVAVAASQNDTYGAEYLTAPEPIDAPPVRGILANSLLGSTPGEWTVLVISANDLRGADSTPSPFWAEHIQNLDIATASNKASAATITHDGVVQFEIPNAIYPWDSNTGLSGGIIDTIAPGHHVTNPGGTVASGWEWHIVNASGRGGVDWDYNFEPFTAPAAGIVDHFNVAGVGMVTRLTLDQPVARTSPQQPHGDNYGPIYSIWFEHTSASIDGPCAQGDVIGTSGDGGGLYAPHLHVHCLTDHSSVAGSTNRACMEGFLGAGSAAPDVAVPLVYPSPVSTIDGVEAGGGAYLFTPEGFAQYITHMQGAPWVLAGIVDVRLVPSWAVSGGGDADFTATIPSLNPRDPSWDAVASIPVFRDAVVSATASPTILDGWRDTVLTDLDAGIYRKILTAPFLDVLVGNGDSMASFRPDQWQHSGFTFEAVTGAAHGDPNIRLLPVGYNLLGDQLGIEVGVGGKAGLAHTGYAQAASQTGNADLTPYLSAYSAQESWIGNQKNRELAILIGLTQIQLTSGAFGIVTALTGGGAGAAQGGLGAVTPGKPISGGSVAAGAIAGALGSLGSIATAQASANNTITMLDVSNNTAFDIAAYQLGLNGVVAVKSFDTWWQTLHSIPGGGSASSLASAWRSIVGQAFQVIIAAPSAERVRKLLSEWRRYGYMIGQAFVPPRLDVMDHYSYWQLTEPTILGNFPQAARDAISGAFERGTTVWGDVAEIGTEPTNSPQAGVTY